MLYMLIVITANMANFNPYETGTFQEETANAETVTASMYRNNSTSSTTPVNATTTATISVATTTEVSSTTEISSSTEVLCTEVSTQKETSSIQTTVAQTMGTQTSTTGTTTTEPLVRKSETTSCYRHWDGEILTKKSGIAEGPSGHETYYNLDMTNCVNNLKNLGYYYEEWTREDGVKMYGPYILCAANLNLRPKGTILETSLGTAIVCDTGGFAEYNETQIDIAVTW